MIRASATEALCVVNVCQLVDAGAAQSNCWPRQRAQGPWSSSLQQISGHVSRWLFNADCPAQHQPGVEDCSSWNWDQTVPDAIIGVCFTLGDGSVSKMSQVSLLFYWCSSTNQPTLKCHPDLCKGCGNILNPHSRPWRELHRAAPSSAPTLLCVSQNVSLFSTQVSVTVATSYPDASRAES